MSHANARQQHCLRRGASVSDSKSGLLERCRAQQKVLISDPSSLRIRHTLKAATKHDAQLTGTSAGRWFLVAPTLPTPNILNAIIKSIRLNKKNHVNIPGLLTQQNSSATSSCTDSHVKLTSHWLFSQASSPNSMHPRNW